MPFRDSIYSEEEKSRLELYLAEEVIQMIKGGKKVESESWDCKEIQNDFGMIQYFRIETYYKIKFRGEKKIIAVDKMRSTDESLNKLKEMIMESFYHGKKY